MSRIPRRIAGIGASDLPNAATFDAYVGPAREITVDQQRGIIALHDGITSGGHQFRITDKDTDDFATALQGEKADSAVQPGDLATIATTGDYDDLTNKPTLGTASAADTGDFAAAAQAVPTGGATGYVLTKASNTDNDVEWLKASSGSGVANFDTVAVLLADNSAVIGYTGSGAESIVATGEIITAQGFRYFVATSGASDHHLATAGGVKLYVLPNADGAVLPLQFGAKGNGIADDTVAWQKAVATGYDIIGTRRATYYTTSKLGVPSPKQKIDLNGSTIIANWEQSTGEYEGVFEPNASHGFELTGGKIEYTGTFDTGGTYGGLVCAVWALATDDLQVNDIELTKFNRAGVVVGALVSGSATPYCMRPSVKGVHAHHNHVGGIFFANTECGVVSLSKLHFNGLPGDVDVGYGFAGWSTGIPKDTVVIGNHCNDNSRKGIDFHAGHTGAIAGNICKRNGIDGIYCMGVRGAWAITGNTIDDMLSDGSYPNAMYALRLGALVGLGTSGEGTSFTVTGNTISNFRKSGAGIAYVIWTAGVGLTFGQFNISGNTFRLGSVTGIHRSQIAVTAGSPGNWFDWTFNGNQVYCSNVTGIPFCVESDRNRKKHFCDNIIVIDTASNGTVGLLSYDSTLIAGNSYVANDNDITAPASLWSAVYDPLGVKRTIAERMESNLVNGAPWRDWDGLKFISSGSGTSPGGTNYWTQGSIWQRTNAAASGAPGGVCITAGAPGTWKDMPALAA